MRESDSQSFSLSTLPEPEEAEQMSCIAGKRARKKKVKHEAAKSKEPHSPPKPSSAPFYAFEPHKSVLPEANADEVHKDRRQSDASVSVEDKSEVRRITTLPLPAPRPLGASLQAKEAMV